MTLPSLPMRPAKQTQHFPAAGFTLVELLVTLTIISVLLAILLPALRSVRVSAQQGLSLHNLKQNAARFYAHAVERRTFPVAPRGDPTADRRLYNGMTADMYSFVNFSQGGGIGFDYLANEYFWNMYLVSLGDAPATGTWYSPSLSAPDPAVGAIRSGVGDIGQPTWWLVPAHYRYSQAYLASPEYFRDPTNHHSAMWRSVPPEYTRHPAVKALLFETASGVAARYPNKPVDQAPTPIAFADGHGGTRQLIDATDPMPYLPHQIPTRPLAQTYNGYLGRDF